MGNGTHDTATLRVSSLLRPIEERVANPVFRAVLRSRFHWIVSDWLVLVSYVGCRSGRRYTFPVAYHQLDGAIVAVTPKRETNWWRNIQGPRECRVWLHGREYTATAALVTDKGRDSLLAGYVEDHPLLGRILGVETDPAAPPGRRVDSSHDLAVVRFALDYR